MNTSERLVRADHSKPDPELVSRVATLLRSGGVVGMRTDTIYGLLGSVNRPDALQRLTDLKVRPVGKPFLILAADWISVRSVTSHLPPVARVLANKYWPGPLTLVLPGEENLPAEVLASAHTVAVRVPGDRLLLDVLMATGAALAAPSANLPGQPPSTSAQAVLELFGDGVDLVVDGGPSLEELPSTIVDCCSSEGEILRAGRVIPEPYELRPH